MNPFGKSHTYNSFWNRVVKLLRATSLWFLEALVAGWEAIWGTALGIIEVFLFTWKALKASPKISLRFQQSVLRPHPDLNFRRKPVLISVYWIWSTPTPYMSYLERLLSSEEASNPVSPGSFIFPLNSASKLYPSFSCLTPHVLLCRQLKTKTKQNKNSGTLNSLLINILSQT